MADNLQGFNDELASNAINAAQRIGEIQDAVRSLRRVLQGETVSTTKEFTDLTASANKFKSLQEKAAKSGKEITKIYQEQSKIHDTITRLSAKIQIANEKAYAASGRQRRNLEKQAEALMHMRDEAKQLSNYYEELVKSSAKLDKTSAYFTQLSKVVDKIPILNKFQKPFEKAAEAARKTAIEAKKAQQVSASVEKRTDRSGRDYYVDLIKGGRTSKTNYLQDQAKVQEAAITAKKTPFGAGMKAIGSEMGGAMSSFTKGAGWIGLLIEAIKFIVELLVSAQQRTVEIAKDLSITREAAEGIRQQYIEIAAQSSNLLMNTKNLVEAQQQFSEYSEAVSWSSQAALTNQVFLTKNLGIAADKAADLNFLMEATGQDIEGSTDKVGNMSKSFAKINGFTVPTAKILKSIAGTSKEIQGYFGFTVEKLAMGVMQMSKFGLQLNDALSLSKSLLDFESSIGNELELELLTGKEFNLERARALAVTGKIAEATDEVLSQMQDLTEEQRQSPLIMESMAKTAGLTADQLNRAYIINKKLGTEAKTYYDQLVKEGRVKEANNLIDQLGEKATKAEMEKTLTVQDAFNAALEKAKDQFSGLVSSGVLDMLVDVISDFAKTMKNWGFGKEQAEKRTNEQAKAAQTTMGNNLSSEQKATLEKLRVQAGGKTDSWFKTDLDREIEKETWARAKKLGIEYQEASDMIEAEAAKKIEEIKTGQRTINAQTGKTEAKVKDFVIKPMNEDTITMAGGTKLGGNVEVLLKELIAEVKAGRNIYLGTQKVNEALGLSLNALG
jgi:hypothetical protein